MTTPDMLELAHETLRDISGGASPDEISALSQFASAAARIAIAERMRPQFVQIGSLVFDPRAIRVIEDDGELLRVHFFSGEMHRYFRGSNRAAFLAWWNECADVVRLPQAPDAPAE